MSGLRGRITAATVALAAGLAAAACGAPAADRAHPRSQRLVDPAALPIPHFRSGAIAAVKHAGGTKIKHLIVITQENHTFDNYFGTYPGAVGFRQTGRPCLPSVTEKCVRPFHDTLDLSPGGPHGWKASATDIDHGRMDGFVEEAEAAYQSKCGNLDNPVCTNTAPKRVMGYYDRREVPNYWAYADHYVLADHFFEATNEWSFPQHLYMVSGWAAKCEDHLPSSCTSSRQFPVQQSSERQLIFAWTDITYLLHAFGVSWRYYVEVGNEPDCTSANAITCVPIAQRPHRVSIWNPLPQFDTVNEDGQLGNIQPVDNYLTDAKQGKLAAISWIVPNQTDSEHSPARVSDGQAFVTRLVNAAMRGPEWRSTAIVVNWDDWGGEYDGLRPPTVDRFGDGIRVPGLIISPWARKGYVDHKPMSTDDLLAFIEDRWLNGQRLDPATDGRPDPRPDIREDHTKLDALLSAFNFQHKPLRRLIRNPRPKTDLTEPAGYPPPTQPCTGPCKK